MDDETRQELWIPPQSSIPAEYQLLETLGYGAEGIVYHAWHKQMHRHSCDPSYVSLEQCEQGVLDARSDLYSLTCVLYECASGHTESKLVSEIQEAKPLTTMICA